MSTSYSSKTLESKEKLDLEVAQKKSSIFNARPYCIYCSVKHDPWTDSDHDLVSYAYCQYRSYGYLKYGISVDPIENRPHEDLCGSCMKIHSCYVFPRKKMELYITFLRSALGRKNEILYNGFDCEELHKMIDMYREMNKTFPLFYDETSKHQYMSWKP